MSSLLGPCKTPMKRQMDLLLENFHVFSCAPESAQQASQATPGKDLLAAGPCLLRLLEEGTGCI